MIGSWLGRLDAAYGRSRGGRRLQRHLTRAMVATSPARWREGQLAVALPLFLLSATILGLGPGLGLAVALGAVRTGGALILRARQHRREAALERAAALLARCLGAELAAGASAGQALTAAGGGLVRSAPALGPLVETALGLTALGEAPGPALAAAAATAETGGTGGMAAVAALLTLHGRAGGDPAGFDRLASALEAAIATRDDARALTAEARLAAVAVPVLAGALGVTLVVTDPAIGVGATTPLAAAVLTGCAAVAVAGTVLARRMAAVP